LAICRLDGVDLLPYQLQNPLDHGIEALQDLFIRKCHIAILNACSWESSLNANIHSPL